eukprot:SM000034S12672  [mRNA]  locus=s34:116735:121941:+ [translate_table: standard]
MTDAPAAAAAAAAAAEEEEEEEEELELEEGEIGGDGCQSSDSRTAEAPDGDGAGRVCVAAAGPSPRVLAQPGEKRKGCARRQAKKQRQRVAAGKGSSTDYFDVYGPQASCPVKWLFLARAEITVHQPEKADAKLKLQDIQGLICWLLADGMSPRWIFVKNKPLVSKVVFLFIPGLDAYLYQAQVDLFPNLGQICNTHRIVTAASTESSDLKEISTSMGSIHNCGCNEDNPVLIDCSYDQEAEGGMFVSTKESTSAMKNTSESSSAVGVIHAKGSPKMEGIDRATMSHTQVKANVVREAEAVVHHGASSSQANGCHPPPFPPSYYLLTRGEMVEQGYPIPREVGDASGCPEGYLMTRSAGGKPKHEMLAIDCEMCYTEKGLELTRVTVVDSAGKVLYDTLVLPASPITDYNTQYSGITKEMMDGVRTSVLDVQNVMLDFISAETILVGHSLQSDLQQLQIVHLRVIDTAVIFAHPRGPPFRPALRVLSEKLLQRTIQDSQKGHDSVEDARAAMDLALLKIRNGPSFGEARTVDPGVSLLGLLGRNGRRCSLIDRRSMLHRFATDSSSALVCSTDRDVVAKAQKEVRNVATSFVWARLLELAAHQDAVARQADSTSTRMAEMQALLTCNPGAEEACTLPPLSPELAAVLTRVDNDAGAIWAALQPNTVLIIATGHGDLPFIRKLQEMKWKRLQSQHTGLARWVDAAEAVVRECHKRARLGLCFVGVKQ